jgi:hypothetical protein
VRTRVKQKFKNSVTLSASGTHSLHIDVDTRNQKLDGSGSMTILGTYSSLEPTILGTYSPLEPTIRGTYSPLEPTILGTYLLFTSHLFERSVGLRGSHIDSPLETSPCG